MLSFKLRSNDIPPKFDSPGPDALGSPELLPSQLATLGGSVGACGRVRRGTSSARGDFCGSRSNESCDMRSTLHTDMRRTDDGMSEKSQFSNLTFPAPPESSIGFQKQDQRLSQMHEIDKGLQSAIEFDDYLEERKTKCTQSMKPETQSVLRKHNPEVSELGLLSSKTSPQSEPSPTGLNSTLKPHQMTNCDKPSKTVSLCANSQTAKTQTDPCGRCGCQRQYHNPPDSYTSAKSGYTSGKAVAHKVWAPTCCDSCPFCLCFCTGFLEPFKGQRYLRCVYEHD